MDLVIYNSTILTMTEKNAKAVSDNNGRIRKFEKVEARKEIDLDGRTLIPGFIDCHTHFIGIGMI
jgi:predicted amidohydrolase YtcJ